MKYFDTESGSIISASDLEKEYKSLFADGATDCRNFAEYVRACTGKNGCLIPVMDIEYKRGDIMKYDYTVEIDCYNESYSHTETLENGTTEDIFTAFDWFESFENADVFEKYRCIEVIARFWVSGSDKVYTDPVNTDSYDVWF